MPAHQDRTTPRDLHATHHRSPGQAGPRSPGRRDYWVALEHDSIWGDHLLPLTVFVGPEARPGRGLVAFGSNHGNEYEGPVALKHLLREIRLEDVTRPDHPRAGAQPVGVPRRHAARAPTTA